MRIAGLDEVGRGSLAGPLVAAGVILKNPISGLNDSKKLSHGQREKLVKHIVESGAEVIIEVVSVRQINSQGMGWANKEIFRKIIKRMKANKYIVDGNLKIKVKGKNIKSVIKADTTRKCVMAASIVAKEFRDELMSALDNKYLTYGWKNNKGYGTKYHIEAIKKHGICIHHRTIFVRTVLGY